MQPPSDERLLSFSVTPDPGVIEVNVHPATSWAQQVERTEQLYEVAREEGLATEKFMLDGRHIGTGGGNHVVMGGIEVPDSPFLRRPDLLKSLLGFWQNHPEPLLPLQRPLHRPVLAASAHRRGAPGQPQRARHRLQPDQPLQGNAALADRPAVPQRARRHDRQHPPAPSSRSTRCMRRKRSAADGRGLVEFRAFEMPPHAQMSLAQTLLMRSAVAAFWQKPYERRLVRWGARLHDEFMLRHYVEQDLKDALATLGEFGFPIPARVVRAASGVPFPDHRRRCRPWRTVGTEPRAGALARSGRGSGRGRHGPLRRQLRRAPPGEGPGLGRGAVHPRLQRCRRAASAHRHPRRICRRHSLQGLEPAERAASPTIDAQSPLIFDIYDRWSGRSLGGLIPLTSRIRAASAMTASRSMRMRPRHAGARASRSTGTPPDRCGSLADRPAPSTPGASICAASRDHTMMRASDHDTRKR